MSNKVRVAGNAFGVIASKKLSEWCQLEPAIRDFSKQPNAGKGSQQSIETIFRDFSFTGDVATPARSLRELVRDADFNDGANCLTDPLPNHHLENDFIRARGATPLGSLLRHRLPPVLRLSLILEGASASVGCFVSRPRAQRAQPNSPYGKLPGREFKSEIWVGSQATD